MRPHQIYVGDCEHGNAPVRAASPRESLQNLFADGGTSSGQPQCGAALLSEFFELLTGNRSNTPQLNVARCQNPEFIVLSIITSYD
jgi:hypothetical protein